MRRCPAGIVQGASDICFESLGIEPKCVIGPSTFHVLDEEVGISSKNLDDGWRVAACDTLYPVDMLKQRPAASTFDDPVAAFRFVRLLSDEPQRSGALVDPHLRERREL